MIQTNCKVVEAQRNQRLTCSRDQFGLYHHRLGAQHIDIALIELAKSSARGTIGAPDGLNLIALEKLWQLRFVLRHHARQRHRQIVTQSEIGLAGLLMFAAFENFEDELIAFFAVLAHQRLDVFDRGSFQRLETVALVGFLDHADDVFTFAHIGRQKIAHAARWLCFG